MTKQQKVHNKIVKLVPEILELKMGCEYLIKDPTASKGNKHRNHQPYKMRSSMKLTDFKPENEIIIIGREITLADVLRAVGDNLQGDYVLEGDTLMFLDPDADDYEVKWEWDLTKLFSQQSQEVYELLDKLID